MFVLGNMIVFNIMFAFSCVALLRGQQPAALCVSRLLLRFSYYGSVLPSKDLGDSIDSNKLVSAHCVELTFQVYYPEIMKELPRHIENHSH